MGPLELIFPLAQASSYTTAHCSKNNWQITEWRARLHWTDMWVKILLVINCIIIQSIIIDLARNHYLRCMINESGVAVDIAWFKSGFTHHRCRSGQILGGVKDFCSNPQICWKNFCAAKFPLTHFVSRTLTKTKTWGFFVLEKKKSNSDIFNRARPICFFGPIPIFLF